MQIAESEEYTSQTDYTVKKNYPRSLSCSYPSKSSND